MRRDTISVHGDWRFDPYTGSLEPPIHVSATYRFGEKPFTPRGRMLKYSREDNPTVHWLERHVALLEGSDDAVAFSSGMAAIAATILGFAGRGARILMPREVYGVTRALAEKLASRLGASLVLAGPPWDEFLEEASRADLVMVETITNPLLHVPPLDEIVRIVSEKGGMLVVDNTFATPVLLRPLELGADIVIHSATKYLSGHNDVVAGIAAGASHRIEVVWEWRKVLGSQLGPFEAYLALRGLKTIHLRVRRHCENARAVAEYLEDHPRVTRVYYPGLPSHPDHSTARRLLAGGYGGVVSFEVRGGGEEALRVMSRVRLIRPAPSLGAPSTLIIHPASSSHRDLPPAERLRLGITDGLLRVAVGLEDPEDIVEDLSRALAG